MSQQTTNRHREQAYADWRVTIGASVLDYCHPAFNAGYDAALALAQPLAEAARAYREHPDTLRGLALDTTLAAYQAALGSPVR